MTVSERLREVRGIKTLAEFSELLGVKGSNISNIENGRSQMSLELAIKISEVYGVSLDWLLKGNGSRDGSPPKVEEPQGDYISIKKDELIELYRQVNQQQQEQIGKLQKQSGQSKNIEGAMQ